MTPLITWEMAAARQRDVNQLSKSPQRARLASVLALRRRSF
jgi:hypothetical protein